MVYHNPHIIWVVFPSPTKSPKQPTGALFSLLQLQKGRGGFTINLNPSKQPGSRTEFMVVQQAIDNLRITIVGGKDQGRITVVLDLWKRKGKWETRIQSCRLLLMEEIMHNVVYPIIYKVYSTVYPRWWKIGEIMHNVVYPIIYKVYSTVYPRWCKISSINSS